MKTKHAEMDGHHFKIPFNRKLTAVWDGEPVTRPMTPYESFAESQKEMGVKVISETTFNLGFALLGDKDYSKLLSIKKV
jgi:hypothetical protein